MGKSRRQSKGGEGDRSAPESPSVGDSGAAGWGVDTREPNEKDPRHPGVLGRADPARSNGAPRDASRGPSANVHTR
jgi:hypothetical protein